MPRVCAHVESPENGGRLYDICERCINPLRRFDNGSFFIPRAVEINGIIIKRKDYQDLSDRQLQMLAETNVVWIIAQNGMKIHPYVL